MVYLGGCYGLLKNIDGHSSMRFFKLPRIQHVVYFIVESFLYLFIECIYRLLAISVTSQLMILRSIFSYCSIAMCICFSQKAIFHWNMVLVSIGDTTNLLYANGHSITMIKELYH